MANSMLLQIWRFFLVLVFETVFYVVDVKSEWLITLRLTNTLVLTDEQKLRLDQKQKGQMWKEGLKVDHEIKEWKMIKRNEDVYTQ